MGLTSPQTSCVGAHRAFEATNSHMVSLGYTLALSIVRSPCQMAILALAGLFVEILRCKRCAILCPAACRFVRSLHSCRQVSLKKCSLSTQHMSIAQILKFKRCAILKRHPGQLATQRVALIPHQLAQDSSVCVCPFVHASRSRSAVALSGQFTVTAGQ